MGGQAIWQGNENWNQQTSRRGERSAERRCSDARSRKDDKRADVNNRIEENVLQGLMDDGDAKNVFVL